jgi:3-oxoacyl-[acyl-carrier-protein] synthase II
VRLPITGVGAVASIGRDAEDIFGNLCAGRGGLAEMRGFDRDLYQARRLFEIDNRPASGAADRTLRATGFLLDAVWQAATEAGLGEDLSGIPILVGTGLRELRSVELWWRDEVDFDVANLHFGTALRERFGATDTLTVSNACSASLYTLALGADLLALGDTDTVIVAGVDSITESMFGLADRVQPEPPPGLLTFDTKRRGTILGDGAAAVVLRAEDVEPGGRLWGHLRSVGVNCDAGHPTAPNQRWVAEAIRQAHRHAGVAASDVDLIMLHGTGTPLNDQVEAGAIAEVLGDPAGGPVMTGIKPMTGHTSGSAGLLSLIVALHVMATGKVPPIVGLTDPIPEADGFALVRDEEAKHEVSLAQVHGFGFGGINAVAIVEAPK